MMQTLRLMTFNVRQLDADDGPNAWPFRRDNVVRTFLECAPDVVGTQELFVEQAQYIAARVPRLAWFGSGRYGDGRDKHNGIFYRRDRFEVVDKGDLWLSETPNVPGSCSWNILKPRMISWARLKPAAGPEFCLFNTHFPYRRVVEEDARRNTARMILERLAGLPSALPVVLTADANSEAGGEIYRTLTARFRDVWTEAASRVGPEGTFNGFAKTISTRRIDWILYRADWTVRLAETVTRRENGRYPSDHFPVIAEFSWGD